MGTEAEEVVVAAEGEAPEGAAPENTTGKKVEGDGSGEVDPGNAAEGDENKDENSEGADAIRKDEIKGLTEDAQNAVNKRIGKVVAREKAAIERADTALSELETARKKLDGGFPEMVKRLGLHGELVSPDEVKTLDQVGKLKLQKAWCRKFEQDGYEGAGGNDPSVSAADVRSKLSEIEDELDDLAPKAREIQARIDKESREIWAAGVAALKNRGKGGQPAKPAVKKGIVKPPVIPGGAGTPKAPASARKSQTGKFNETEFKQSGGGRTALQQQFEKLYP